MNPSELSALQQPISNDARVLYCLGLRPYSDAKSGRTAALNYKQLLLLLNAKSKIYQLGREINGLFAELIDAGLVTLPEGLRLNQSFNGKTLLLPLLMGEQDVYDTLHMQWQAMTLDWQPTRTLFDDLAKLVGIIDKEYSQQELGEFIAYWMGRPQMQFSQYQWTQKFVFQIKQKRLAVGVKALQKVGNQLVIPAANVEADDNAKKLVEKYSKKPEK